VEEQGGSIVSMMARMMSFNQFQGSSDEKPPADQYKALLAERKLAATLARRQEKEYDALSHSGFVIKIAFKLYPALENPQDKKDGLLVWRRFRVSGGISLNALQDRILQSVMGWGRRHHSCFFCDTRDGATFGPKEHMFIDYMH
jgi:hypothetical protein